MPGRQPGGGPPGNGGRICRQTGEVWLLLDAALGRSLPVYRGNAATLHKKQCPANIPGCMQMAALTLTPGGGMPGGGIPGRGGMP